MTDEPQVKAVIFGLDVFLEDKNVRIAEAIDLLADFSQTTHANVFDDSERVLKELDIFERENWKLSGGLANCSPGRLY